MIENIVYISTGSNIGDREANLQKAIELINKKIGTVLVVSGIYQTAAWGGIEQADYYNQVLELKTKKTAKKVLELCLSIEQKMGRERIERWGARNIDVDILFYGNDIIDSEKLVVPHPRLHLRNFVLLPICELNPSWIHPIFKKNMQTLLNESKDDLEAKLIIE